MKKAILSLALAIFGLYGHAQTVKLDLSGFSQDSTGLSLHLRKKFALLDKIPSQKLAVLDGDFEQQIISLTNKKAQLQSFWTLGFYLRERNIYRSAIKLIENALVLAQEITTPAEGDITNTLADLYSKVGEPGKALDVLMSQLTIFEKRRDLAAQVKSRSLLVV
jgi:hypothetical protein